MFALSKRLRLAEGQAMVEAAVVFPLLVMAVVGLVQFGLFYHAQNVVTAATQEGSRVAASVDRTVEEGEEQARLLLRAGLGQMGESVAVQGVDVGDAVIVAARGHLRTIIPWVADVGLPLQVQSVVAKERFRAGPGR